MNTGTWRTDMPTGKKGRFGVRIGKKGEGCIEYNSMNPACYQMWDLKETEPVTELCPWCGYNNIHSEPAPPYVRFNEADSSTDYKYDGPNIFDQYGRY